MTDQLPDVQGKHTYHKSRPVVLVNAGGELLEFGDSYETVAASQADQALGATGAAGDFLAGLLIVPETTSPGSVSVKDGNGSAIMVFAGGSNSIFSLVPFFAPFGAKSSSGAWSVSTGADVSVVAFGNFT